MMTPSSKQLRPRCSRKATATMTKFLSAISSASTESESVHIVRVVPMKLMSIVNKPSRYWNDKGVIYQQDEMILMAVSKYH